MPLSLAVTDNCDGTAAVTVAGAAGAGAVLRASLLAPGTPAAWATAWAFSGDGTETVAVAAGHWAWAALAAGELSPLVYRPTCDGTPALATACRHAVAARITLLGLTGIGSRVYVRAEPRDANVIYPCVFVCPVGQEASALDGGTNLRSDWGHPVGVFVADRRDPAEGDAAILAFDGWRQSIFRAFDRQRLPGVGMAVMTTVEPGPVAQFYLTDPGNYILLTTELTVRVAARQPRGVGF